MKNQTLLKSVKMCRARFISCVCLNNDGHDGRCNDEDAMAIVIEHQGLDDESADCLEEEKFDCHIIHLGAKKTTKASNCCSHTWPAKVSHLTPSALTAT